MMLDVKRGTSEAEPVDETERKTAWDETKWKTAWQDEEEDITDVGYEQDSEKGNGGALSAQDDTLGISVMQYYVLHRDMSAGTYTGLLCLFTCLKDIWVDTDSKKSGRR